MRRVLAFLAAGVVALIPGAALADGESADRGVAVFVDHDGVVAAGERIGTVVVIDGRVEVRGTVQNLVVVTGTAVITGEVAEKVTVVNGDLDLQRGAVVNDVSLVRSDLIRAEGATVRGEVRRSTGVWWRGWAVVAGIIFVVGVGLALVLGGVAFAMVGGGTLGKAAAAMSSRPGQTIGWAAGTAVGLPVVAALLIGTLVGIPVGLGLLVCVLPALAFLGYIVTGTWIGGLIIRRPAGSVVRPVKEALVGLLIMMVAVAVPGVGALVSVVAGLWGMGALMDVAWRNARLAPASPAAPLPPAR